jgi:glycosyltransferase involved in cell wall biosynthesis
LSSISRKKYHLSPCAPSSKTIPTIAIIIPALNEASSIAGALTHVQHLSGWHECLVTDGGSDDHTCVIARAHPLRPRVITALGGRASQLNVALNHVTSDVVVILSVDCRFSHRALEAIRYAVAEGAVAGCLRLRNATSNILFRVHDHWARLRTRWTTGAYVDQAPFFVRQLAQKHGFRPLAGYDTADLGRRVSNGRALPVINASVVASCRHWHRHGLWRGTWMHQRLRLRYWFQHL